MLPFQNAVIPSFLNMSLAAATIPDGLAGLKPGLRDNGSAREWYESCRRIFRTSRGAIQKRETRPATAPERMTWPCVPSSRRGAAAEDIHLPSFAAGEAVWVFDVCDGGVQGKGMRRSRRCALKLDLKLAACGGKVSRHYISAKVPTTLLSTVASKHFIDLLIPL
jgi:hypothetical protein